ncbi:pyruvoyl-dependent arginine decarboxylase [Millisia brevis]|uniref:pyruvoyl-dependent arginine decarboxylase n=1 Tax=Millisia brevis TaxID=264148 RepID=UPI001FDFD4DE|nr:pyruvoyl-dependent arginine decarboxylase [Millisia brevis]
MIELAATTATGPTPLAAFDHALRRIGVGDVNLVRLSSVIPPGSIVAQRDRVYTEHAWGDRLYCVWAMAEAKVPGTTASAGIAWAFRQDGSDAGLFVEDEGSSPEAVEWTLTATLEHMIAGRNIDFGPIESRIVTATCTDEPVCALVLASYQSASWRSDAAVPAAAMALTDRVMS